MNYQHAYHAGNFADVHKHVIVHALLEALQQKASPFAVLDTHAGAGRYDLAGKEATATGEAAAGIGRLLPLSAEAPALVQRWLQAIVPAAAQAEDLRSYPGSPLQVAGQLRAGDALQLCELQSNEVAQLRACLGANPQVHIHQRDGYAAMKALLPPPQKRGLVLIDPPYEAQEAEYRSLQERVGAALDRWPGGIYAIWYPIKQRQWLQPFYRWLGQCQARRVLRCELLAHEESPLRLIGSGMVVLNAPWQLDRAIAETLDWLAERLGEPGRRAETRLDWLRQD